jgi:type 1 glutamine amidotransferase
VRLLSLLIPLLLLSGSLVAEDAKPKRLLLVSQGPDGHPPGTHEYVAGQKLLAQSLAKVPGLEVTTSFADDDWGGGPELLGKCDGVVLFLSEGGKWMNADPRRKEALVRLAERGGGITGLHWGIGTKDAKNIGIVLQLLGACHGGPDRKYKVFAANVTVAAKDHPIAAGLQDFRVFDEFYYQLKRDQKTSGFTSLLTVNVPDEKEPQTVCWSWERPAGGRSFGFSGGHFHDNWRRPEYQRLFAQGILWTLHLQPPQQDFPAPLAAEEPLLRLTGQIVEQGKPVAARVYLQGESGRWFFPQSAAAEGSAIPFQRERPETSSVEMHSTLSAHPFTIDLPRGKYTLTVERGKEYLPLIRQFTLDKEPLQLTLEISRWIDMKSRGWYSGDTHIHHNLASIPNLMLAEDLNIAFPLTYWVTTADTDPIRGNRSQLTGPVKAEVIQVAKNHLLYPLNTEYEIFSVGGKQHTLGAFVLIGHKTPLDVQAPAVIPIAERVHREGGLIDLEKHSWPWSVVIVPTMKVDLFELANNHVWRTEFGFPQWTMSAAGDYMHLEKDSRGFTEWGWIDFGWQTYYALLNCGFRLQPTAGTAAGVHPVPMGFGRVYVHQPDGFSYENWLQGLKAGRSFVSTGPMLEVQVNGELPGHVFAGAQGGKECQVKGTVTSASAIDRIEILVNGQIVKTIPGESQRTPAGGFDCGFETAVKIDGSCWLAVRCFEKHPTRRIRFAHTAPWHFEVAGRPLLPRQEEIDYLRLRCREEIERNRTVVGPAALKEYEQALTAYEEIAKRLKP